MGVIAKRPGWQTSLGPTARRPARNGYGYPYWERLQKLKYDFLRARSARLRGNSATLCARPPQVFIRRLSAQPSLRGFRKMNTGLGGRNLARRSLRRPEVRSRWREIAGSDWAWGKLRDTFRTATHPQPSSILLTNSPDKFPVLLLRSSPVVLPRVEIASIQSVLKKSPRARRP